LAQLKRAQLKHAQLKRARHAPDLGLSGLGCAERG